MLFIAMFATYDYIYWYSFIFQTLTKLTCAVCCADRSFFCFVFFLGISAPSVVDSTMKDVGTQTDYTHNDVVFLILHYIERLLYIITNLPATNN